MSPDDTDADEESSGASGDGQPRDPETGQFLPKDERETASDDEEAASDAEETGDEPERDGSADEPDSGVDTAETASASDAGDDSARSDPAPHTSRARPPGERGHSAPPLVVRQTDLGTGSPGAADRPSEPRRPPLPPSLDLVPQQVALTGEPVRGREPASPKSSPLDRPQTAPSPPSGTGSARPGPARPSSGPPGPGPGGNTDRRHETGGPPQ